MRFWWLFIGLIVSLPAKAVTELELRTFTVANEDAELSGMASYDGGLILVSDGGSDTTIMRAGPVKDHRFALKDWIDLTKWDGFDQYKAGFKNEKRLKEKHQRFDLEGIAVCSDVLYLVNERVRQVFKVTASRPKKLEALDLKIADMKDIFEGGANAGLEGIAVDCERQHLFVAKERDPPRLYKYDLKTNKLLKEGDFAGSDRQGMKVINPWSGEGLFTIGPDVADLYFTDGHLYALERNTYEVTKLNPDTFAVVDRVSYWQTENNLYETPEPFGLAEALVVRDDEIIIAFDNNHFPLSRATEKKYGVTGTQGALLYFQRPKGF